MNLRSLELLVADGESEGLEFKKSTGGLRGGMESLCGFLNGRGGQVLFGVTNVGAIVGQQISDRTLQEVAAEIAQLDPPAPIEQIRIPAGRQEVLMVATSDLSGAPHTYRGRAYQRIGTTTSIMPQEEYERRLLQRGSSGDTKHNCRENSEFGLLFVLSCREPGT